MLGFCTAPLLRAGLLLQLLLLLESLELAAYTVHLLVLLLN